MVSIRRRMVLLSLRNPVVAALRNPVVTAARFRPASAQKLSQAIVRQLVRLPNLSHSLQPKTRYAQQPIGSGEWRTAPPLQFAGKSARVRDNQFNP